MNLLISKIT